jgi:5-oxoprolinase (ATP-hydrolysing) subunit A
MHIDINCDMGESFGRYQLGNDAGIMPHITSANIACGLHAGDPVVMRKTVRLAKQYGVRIGAHPGWPDLQGFGRREMTFAADEVGALVLYQISALAGVAKAEGSQLFHVKPHGALYNQATKDRTLALAIASAVVGFSRDLVLVGLAGSLLIEAGLEAGLQVMNEGFPDRRYNADGSLVSRTQAGAIIGSPDEVAAHAVELARNGIDFGGRRVQVETLCLHGDHARAAENAEQVRQALLKAGIEVRALTL